jgi:putative hemolysin
VLVESPHSLLPVGDGSVDTMVGVVQARQLLAAVLSGRELDIRALTRPAPIVPDTMDALDVMAKLRDSDAKMVLVHDEYGHFEGVVTPADLLEAITGVAPEHAEARAVQREDGSWLLAGSMPADEMAETLGIVLPPARDYQTLAGFMLAHIRHLPSVGESCIVLGWRFEVVDLDGKRIDRVLAERLPARPGAQLRRRT